MTGKTLIALVAAITMLGLASGAQAGTDLEKALKSGATRLTSDEIAERLTGKTVTFVSAKTGDKYLVYYGEDNKTAGRKAGSDKTKLGFHAVNDRDQICLGWEGSDLPRLRCMDILLIDGKMHKFKADGSLGGYISETAEGNTT
ncbi:MAG: hypothetical protein R3285_08450 [Kiloniellales bacterium]|nr:hypothetical protein [Kiloniellales bacterium]